MPPGKGCAGISAVTIGVLIPVAGSGCEFGPHIPQNFYLHFDMKLFGAVSPSGAPIYSGTGGPANPDRSTISSFIPSRRPF